MNALDVRCRGDHGDDPSPETLSGAVGSVVAHDHGRPPLVGLCAADGIEIDEANLASSLQVSPSLTADSHASASSRDHSSQASS